MSKRRKTRGLKRQRSGGSVWLTLLLILLLLTVAFLLWVLIRPQGGEESESQSTGGESEISAESETSAESTIPVESEGESGEESREESRQESKEESRQESEESSEESQSPEVDTSLFDDAVFIGDSRTQGLQMATGLTNAKFLAERSMAVNRCDRDAVFRLADGSKGTVLQALAEKQYAKVYIMFGVNELGWPSAEAFADSYAKLIDQVRELQPSAVIYIQSILPISAERAEGDPYYNNENVNAFNAAVQKMVKNRDVVYLDVASVLRDETGALPADASTDGIHLNFSYCWVWLKYLADHQQ